jgi:hypothetical protein
MEGVMAENAKCQSEVSLSSDSSMAALPALMLILSDSSAPASSDRAVTTIDAMQLNDNEPQICRGTDSDTDGAYLFNSSKHSRQFLNVDFKCFPVELQTTTQRDFDQELRLQADEQSLEKDLCKPVCNIPLNHGDSGRYFDSGQISTLDHVVADAREDVSRVWENFLTSLDEPDDMNCRKSTQELDPSRTLLPAVYPMPPPKRFYHYVWRSFGRRLIRQEQEGHVIMSMPAKGTDAAK